VLTENVSNIYLPGLGDTVTLTKYDGLGGTWMAYTNGETTILND